MNAKSYRVFVENLKAATAAAQVIATPKPREPLGVWRLVDKHNPKVESELTYTDYDYDGGPRVYLGPGTKQTKIKKLTVDNLTAHLLKLMSKRHAEVSENALAALKDSAEHKAEAKMVKQLTEHYFIDHTWELGVDDIDSPIWRRGKDWFKMAYVEASGAPDSFTFTYTIEYSLNEDRADSGTPMKGEFVARNFKQIVRVAATLISI